MSSSTWTYDFDNPLNAEFSSQQLLDLIIIALAFSLLSALGSIFILVTFFKFPRMHTFAYKIIMMLAVANLCLDFAYLVGDVGHDNWKCTVQGWARVYFSLVEFALVTAITLTCYLMVVRQQFHIQEHFMTVMAYCWLAPLFMSLLPFTTDNYGGAGAWCSITSKDLKSLVWGTFWRFAVIYVPLWISVGVNAYMCIRVYSAVKGYEMAMAAYDDEIPDEPAEASAESEDSEQTGTVLGIGEAKGREGKVEDRGEGDSVLDSGTLWGDIGAESNRAGMREGYGSEHGLQHRRARSMQKKQSSTSMGIVSRLRLYPIALVVCWSWATVNRVYEAIDPYNPIFWLYVLQYAFQTVHGFFNLIVFLRTPGVLDEWHVEIKKFEASCRRLRCCRKVTDVDRSALLLRVPRSDAK